MRQSRRRGKRCITDMTLNVFMQDELKLTTIVAPTSCYVRDLSSYGAGLIFKKIQFDGYHLLYTPAEKSECKLYLTQEGTEKDQINLPVKPIWYNLVDIEDKKYFHLGVEFLAAPKDPRVSSLQELAKKNLLNTDQTWLGDRLVKLLSFK